MFSYLAALPSRVKALLPEKHRGHNTAKPESSVLRRERSGHPTHVQRSASGSDRGETSRRKVHTRPDEEWGYIDRVQKTSFGPVYDRDESSSGIQYAPGHLTSYGPVADRDPHRRPGQWKTSFGPVWVEEDWDRYWKSKKRGCPAALLNVGGGP